MVTVQVQSNSHQMNVNFPTIILNLGVENYTIILLKILLANLNVNMKQSYEPVIYKMFKVVIILNSNTVLLNSGKGKFVVRAA